MGKCYQIYFLETTETSQEWSLDCRLETVQKIQIDPRQSIHFGLFDKKIVTSSFFFAIISVLSNPELSGYWYIICVILDIYENKSFSSQVSLR